MLSTCLDFEDFVALKNEHVKKLLLYIRRRAEMSEHTFIVVLAVLIGLLGGLGAVGFRWLIKAFQRLFFGSWEYSLELAQSLAFRINCSFQQSADF